jgi:uncharacterized damage-inducible protein DinB
MSASHQAIQELLTSTLQLIETFADLDARGLGCDSGHPCANGGDVWQLMANLVDHETEHTGNVAMARYESASPRTPAQRMLGEWLEARTRFASHLVGMSDEQYEAPMAEGQWSFAKSVKHLVELQRHACETVKAEAATRSA